MRILVVEDDADLRLLLVHSLVDARYQVDGVADVREAEKALARTRYDLVVADGRLPDGTGMDVADTAKARGLATLIVTGYAFHPAMAGLAHYDFLLKPVRPAELLAAIDRLLARDGTE
jgi:two-component system, NtrC family, response regulator HydG